MSKTADSKKPVKQAKPKTQTAPKEQPTKAAKAQPVQEPDQAKEPVQGESTSKSSSNDLLGKQLANLVMEMNRTNRKLGTCAQATVSMGTVVKHHDAAIEKLDLRVSHLEKELDICYQSTQDKAPEEPTKAEKPSQPAQEPEPEPKAQQQPDDYPVIEGCNFTGKMKLYFPCNPDGSIDLDHPFPEPSGALQFSLKYAKLRCWVENGKFKRTLNIDEAAGIW